MARTITSAIGTKLTRRKAAVVGAFHEAQTRARTDPVWFAKNILNLRALPGEPTLRTNPDLTWEMDEWQIELLEAAADVYRKLIGLPTVINHDGKPYITVRAPHGPGKTFGAAMLMHWFGFCFPGLIPCTAPKLDQLKSRLWREFRKISARAFTGYSAIAKVDATKITWGNRFTRDDGTEGGFEWYAIAETANAPENLAGFHDQHIMFIIDEASGVPEELYPVVFSALSTGYLRILLMIGNPTRIIGTFADSHLKQDVSKDFYKLHISLDKTKRVKRDWVAQMERQYGRDSPIVKVRCYGDFADAGDFQLIPLQWIVDARNREFNTERGDGSFPRLRVSVDVADGGLDETVVTIARHYDSFVHVLRVERYNFEQHLSPILAAKKALELYVAWGGNPNQGDDIVVDSMGVGAGTAGWLLDNPMPDGRRVPMIPYRGGEASDNIQRWRNRRVQSYLVLRDALREGRIVLADDLLPDRMGWSDFEAQLCSIRVKPGTERVEDLISKEDMRREGIKSPDIADSLAMQFMTRAPSLGTRAPFLDELFTVESPLMENF